MKLLVSGLLGALLKNSGPLLDEKSTIIKTLPLVQKRAHVKINRNIFGDPRNHQDI